MNAIVTDAAALIADHNPALAALFVAKPFARVALAHAFAAGFASGSDEPHPAALLVLRVAYLDRDSRQVAA